MSPAGCRPAQARGPALLLGMSQIRAVERSRVAKHGRCLFERDSVFGAVDRRLPRVPLEHYSVYTKLVNKASVESAS